MYTGKNGSYEFHLKFAWILCDCFLNEKDKKNINARIIYNHLFPLYSTT